ncbi:hypothetical protein T02_12137 [Trichinella nativa]|uniref:Uncharacterized protein n=1 Tax=Trichinella nativa TaxID=6335 RepID=A0A0V1L3N6_9BILA|nr:hypothetical protein T02_12137 [Trichinella nativa]
MLQFTLILIITYASDLIVYEKNLCLMGRLTVSFDFYFASCLGFSSNNIKGISGNVLNVKTQQRKNVRSTTVTSTDKHNQHYQLHHYCHSSSKLSNSFKSVLCKSVDLQLEHSKGSSSSSSSSSSCSSRRSRIGFVHCYSIELNSSSLRELTCQFLMRFVEKLLKHETDSGLKNQSKNERGQAGGVSTWEFVSPAASVEKRYFSCLSSNAIDLLLLDSVTHPMYNNQFLLLKIF